MVVVVRDSISGFLLWPGKRPSKSYEAIREVLSCKKGMFGSPSDEISDMRHGIITALDDAFQEIPRLLCLFNFLCDTGSYLMKSMNIDLRRVINTE